jgi:hypothetical protein
MENWMQSTRLFRQWSEVKQAVNDHKWYESEKAGHDIGWERAYTEWMIRHGADRDSRSSDQ